MRQRPTLLLLLALAAGLAVPALSIARLVHTAPAEARAEQFAARNTTAYTLPPEKLRKAVALTRIRIFLIVAGLFVTFAQLILVLNLGIAARMGAAAARVTKYRSLQVFVFLFLLFGMTRLLLSPLNVYSYRVAAAYGLSVQSWGSWLADKAKIFGLMWLVGGLLLTILLWIVRRSPARWWFWFWIPTVLCVLLGVFIEPYVVDPLFYKFEPLAQTEPALVQRLEQVVARSGIAIPPERMFLMRASAKSTEINAYVTGFGASKRVVVWDTTLAQCTPDEISVVFAHEMGHYALGHIPRGIFFTCGLLLPLFWLGFHGVRLLLARFGAAWRIDSQDDLAAAAVFVLVFYSLAFLSEPIFNGFSRSIEHAADVYGQEAVHGIVADPQAVARQSFQTLGEKSYDDPTPHPLIEFWFYDHPALRTRAAFAEAYDPWVPGAQPKYVAK
jgi:STE24 endopeptidase